MEDVSGEPLTADYCPAGHPLFRSGFEGETRGFPADAHEIFEGMDDSCEPPNDWGVFRARLSDAHPWACSCPASPPFDDPLQPQLGYFDIQYMGGTAAQRAARIVEDPTCSGNHVLHFQIARANELCSCGAKARIQACIYENRNLTSLYYQVRMYLDPGLDALREWTPGFNWFTLQEYWFAPDWAGEGQPFRISLGLYRKPGEGRQNLHFCIHGQPGVKAGMPEFPGHPGWGHPTWASVQTELDVPTGIWMECKTCYRMGDAESGRFIFQVRFDGGPWTNVFDVTDWTYNPRARQPDSLYGWSPMKLYTASALIDHVRQAGSVAQIYWDDLEIYSDWRDSNGSPSLGR